MKFALLIAVLTLAGSQCFAWFGFDDGPPKQYGWHAPVADSRGVDYPDFEKVTSGVYNVQCFSTDGTYFYEKNFDSSTCVSPKVSAVEKCRVYSRYGQFCRALQCVGNIQKAAKSCKVEKNGWETQKRRVLSRYPRLGIPGGAPDATDPDSGGAYCQQSTCNCRGQLITNGSTCY